MEVKRALIVEDDANIARLIKYNIEREGFRAEHVITGEEAIKRLAHEAVDIVVLDVMLPKMDGFETCRRIRKMPEAADVRVIMLTAKGEEIDRIVGLELGADDYMVKPFSPRELVLRMKAVLKRHEPEGNKKDILTVGAITLNVPRHTVHAHEREVSLSPMEFKLLEVLMRRQGRVQTRETLLDDVWGISAEVTTRTVDTHVKLLRQKLGRAAALIETVRGLGYKIRDED